MRCGKALLGLALAGLAPTFVLAQTPTPGVLVKEGDTIIGLGALTLLTSVGINDSKMWIALVDTNFTDSNFDGCVLRNGFVTLREGATLFSPANSILDDWSSISLTNKGDLGMIIKVKTGSTVVDGAYWNMLPVALKDTLIPSPLLGPGSDWEKLEIVKMNSSNTMLILGEIQNTAIGGASSKEDALIRYQLDNLGNIQSFDVLATKGQDVPVMGTTVNTLGNAETILALNNRGDYITVVLGVGVVAVLANMDTLLAQEGNPSPVSGRSWRTLSQSKVAINDRRDFVYTGALFGDTPDTYLIVKGNLDDAGTQSKFAQAGDILPELSTQPLANGSAAPNFLANNGDIFWRAEAVGTSEDAFMRNYTPIIQLNKTVVNGNLVTRVEISDSFAISPNGRFFVGRVDMQVVGAAALLVDFGLILEVPACNPNPGKLSATGDARVGQQITFAMDQGQVAGALPVVLFSSSRRGTTCGVPITYGELIIGPKNATLFMSAWNGTSPSTLQVDIPDTASLVDTKLYAQGYFRDVAHATGEEVRLTDALQIEIGAP